MPSRTYAPRSYLVRPTNFGRFQEVQWREVVGEQEADRLTASQWQHFVAVAVRDSAQYLDKTLDRVAEETRVGKQQFWRMMRGDIVMQLEDFAAMRRIFNIRLLSAQVDVEPRAGTQVEPGE